MITTVGPLWDPWSGFSEQAHGLGALPGSPLVIFHRLLIRATRSHVACANFVQACSGKSIRKVLQAGRSLREHKDQNTDNGQGVKA